MKGSHLISISMTQITRALGHVILSVDYAASPAEAIVSAFTVQDDSEDGLDQKHGASFLVPNANAFGHAFRSYDGESERRSGVADFYRTNHTYQTYNFALNMRKKHLQFNKGVMSIWECCELLNEYVDESDPDLDEPQIEHLLQTAEAIRKDHPDEDWFHLTGLIHDLGKVLLHPKFGQEPQWAVVGDTYPLGCAFDENIVHSEYFKDNMDFYNPKFNSKNGIYEEGCGLDKVQMSWGHDEYLYQVLKCNNTTLPPQALFIIRYHSFYALHRAGAYQQFLDANDREMLQWLLEFNKYDLYSKSKVRINVEEVKPYYISLIEKYFPIELRW
ncbi:hypothetical protein O6H91_12G012400 [Diphasiastrum complanatum]|uniref:Uncharacterized protein n=1 Tax=Diphasiastrum complanatum TaxID=34168 RepID=A0ACC2BYU7_DIPCM|nr:hypothetical protein O6H91_12G012400 [Diphasiastrum complanatum]